MSFFGSNPLLTPVGQRIDKATTEGLASEDWGLNMEICDIINETEEGPKDAMKAIKKKMVGNKKWKEVMFALTVLETCVKNCGHRFHLLVCKRDFIQELVKIIQPNINPPTVVQEKILSLIQTWSDAFRSAQDMQGVVKVYEEMRTKGIEFPATDLDALSPIHTPIRGTPEIDPAVRQAPIRQPSQTQTPAQGQQMPPGHPMQAHPMPGQQVPPQMMPGQQPQQQQQQAPAQPPGPVTTLSPDQLAKLRRDLDTVLGNVRVMSEMLTEMTPGQETTDNLELLQELNRTCRSMQQRLVQLLDRISNEEVTGELLRVNDDLNNVFVRYDRYERYRQNQQQPSPQQPNQPAGLPPTAMGQPPSHQHHPQEAPTASLIDLGIDTSPAAAAPPATAAAASPGPPPAYQPQANPASASLTQQLAGLELVGGSTAGNQQVNSTTGAGGNDDFDMFAQSRQISFQDSRKSGSTYEANTNVDQSGGGLGNLVQGKAAPNPFQATQPSQSIDQNIDQDIDQNIDELIQGLPGGPQGVDEMEKWLQASDLGKPEDGLAAANTHQPEEPEGGITSSEFDKFLQERAKVGDTLPGNQQQGGTAPLNTPSRQMQMEETENTMFAL